MDTVAISRERIKALREAKAWSPAHRLVARANQGTPAHPTLDNGATLASLAVFLAGTAIWVLVLNRHFRR